MIDIPGIYVGRFKDDPNQSTMLMQIGDTPTYTDDNWANVESTGTIWRYNAKAGEWVDTGLEEILVEEVSGTKQIVAEGTVPWKLQGLNVYGKSTQQTTTGAQLLDISNEETFVGTKTFQVAPGVVSPFIFSASIEAEQGEDTIMIKFLKQGEGIYTTYTSPGTTMVPITFDFEFDSILLSASNNNSNSQGKTVTYKNAMLNSGATALPWEPYTGGKPSPSPNYPQEIVTAGTDGSIDITVSDGSDQSQKLSIQTPNGLPGIPVESGGNYTDASGQQWVCDEVDFERGVYVKRVIDLEFDGSENWRITTRPNITLDLGDFLGSILANRYDGYCTVAKYEYNYGGNCIFVENIILNGEIYPSVYVGSEFLNNHEIDTVQKFKNMLSQLYEAGTPMKIMFPIDINKSTETPLTDSQFQAYKALMSYDDTTVISTDEDISGISAKVVTDVISKNAWFDPYAELALYYKALAGFESLDNLPMPHSRESSLVRKLLDSSYELGFSVNENSSRNERYLWDLINGTSTMLTNIPKSDTEKFLHVMIGGTVEEYPVVDTELDYWMDKCVHYMSSNGNIGG